MGGETRALPFGIARLIALDALERATAKDYIDWAMGALTAGASQPSIAILAGMVKGTTYFEAKEYFLQAMQELEVEEPSESKFDIYIEAAAKEILAGNLNYKELLCFAREFQFQRQAQDSKYDLRNLYLLNYAVEGLESGDEYWDCYYEGLDTVNPVRSVELECKILLGIEKPEASPLYREKEKSLQAAPVLDATDSGPPMTGLAIERSLPITPLQTGIALLLGIALIMAMRWLLSR